MKKLNTKGTPKQDLTAARAELKAFRHEVALLKKKGLLDKKYDARSIKPTKYLKSQVKKFKNVLLGNAQPVKISSKKVKYYQDQGYAVKNNRVVVPVASNEKVYGTHGDFRIKTMGEFGSITRIDLGLSKRDITKWKEELRNRKIKLKEGERITFQMFGNNSYMSFVDFEKMVDYLDYYPSLTMAENSPDAHKHQEYIENVVIYKVERNGQMPPPQIDNDVLEMQRSREAIRKQKWRERMSPDRQVQFNKDRAEAEKNRRAKLAKKLTPEQIEEQKKKARLRAQKSYAARSGKNGQKESGGN